MAAHAQAYLLTALFVDAVAGDLRSFVEPQMSLSSARAGMQQHQFRIALDESSVLNALRGPYEQWVRDSRLDDQGSGGPVDALAHANYPPLHDVLRTPELLDLVIAGYLRAELLQVFAWDGSREIIYWLDVVNDCRFESGILTLDGCCYSK